MSGLSIGKTVIVSLAEDQTTTGIISKIYPSQKKADVELLNKSLTASAPNSIMKFDLTQLKLVPANQTKVKKNQNNVLRVKPKSFPSLYLKQFGDWMESTFFPYREITNQPSTGKRRSLKYYQRLIRDYLASPNSPYRGILIYHGLGAGKTCTAIATAEALKSTRNIVVILPASIRQNFVKELMTSCGDIAYETNANAIKKTYHFVSYNAANAIAQLDAIGSLDHHTIIIDEVHNLVQMMISPQSSKGPAFYKRLFEAKDVKIIALSGTPAIQNAFEVAILANILRGNLITAVLKVEGTTNGRKRVDESWLNILTEAFDNDEDWVHFDWSASQIDAVYGGSYPASDDPQFLSAVDRLVNKGKELGISMSYQGIKTVSGETASGRVLGTPLFPEEQDVFANTYLEEQTLPISSLKMPKVFEDVAVATKAKRGKVTNSQAKKLFTGEVKVFVMKNPENFMRRLQGLISYYPGGDPKVYPKLTKKEFVAIPMSDYQFQQYEVVRQLEREHDDKLKARRGRLGSKDSEEIGTSLFRTLSRQFSNFVFPVQIQRPLKSYWQDLIGKRLSSEDYMPSEKEEKEEEQSKREIQTRYEESITNALINLMNDPNKPLEANNSHLGQYSPKMLKIYENIEATKGISLVYSFYKTLEGVGIFGKVLEANGWKRFILPSVSKKDPIGMVNAFWNSVNKSIDEKKPGHVFAFWSGDQTDEERRAIQLIFNDPRNRYGAYMRVLLITKAAAEGVDLHNIRAVHIMDPHWNETLMEQVIGRAVRLGSHLNLPDNERTVEVYRYLATMTPTQREIDLDGMSTDEYLLQLAVVKHTTVEQVKMALRRSAFDCRIFEPRITKEGHESVKCFRAPVGSSGMFYLPDWRADLGYGKVVSQVRRKEEKWEIVLADGDKNVYKIFVKEKEVEPIYGGKRLKLTDLKKPIRKLIWNVDSSALAVQSGDVPTPVGYLTKDGKWDSTVSL